MQRILFVFVFIFLATGATRAQDVIHFMDSTTVSAVVKTIAPRTITYKRSDNPNGPDYTVNVNKVHHVALANGTEVSFAELHPHGIPQPHHPRSRAEIYAAHKLHEPPMQERFQLKVAPSSLFDQWGMMLPVYAEYDLGRYFGIELMAAIPFDRLPPVTIKRRPMVTGIKSDSKFSLNLISYIHSWKNGHLYVAGEGLLRHQVITLGNGSMTLGNSQKFESFTSSDLIKTYYGISFKFGVTARITGHLWFDTYAGIGCISGTSHHTNVQNQSQPEDIGHEYMFGGYSLPNNIEGNGVAIYIPFAIRLTYHFNRQKK